MMLKDRAFFVFVTLVDEYRVAAALALVLGTLRGPRGNFLAQEAHFLVIFGFSRALEFFFLISQGLLVEGLDRNFRESFANSDHSVAAELGLGERVSLGEVSRGHEHARGAQVNRLLACGGREDELTRGAREAVEAP